MTIWNRRDFLKASGLTGLALGLNAFSPELLRRQLVAGDPEGDTKMIFIFLRGGNDAVNTVIPYGDSEYSAQNRPTLYIPQADALDLGNGFAGLHPMLEPMMSIYDSLELTGVDGPGNLAILHRIGYSGQSQSHFDSQQYWENGTPGNPSLEEGMLYRQTIRKLDPEANRLAAAALSSGQMVALKGETALPTISDPEDFTFRGSSEKVAKFLGELPGTPSGTDGKGLLGLYGGPKDFAAKPYRNLVYGTGLALADAIDIVQTAVNQGRYDPANGAEYPGGRFGDRLQQAAMLMKRTPARILGVNMGGYDTHTNQGQIYGNHGNLLSRVAEGYQALFRDLQDQWENLLIVTMTEFGRTSRENGSRGTDHAYATAMFVAGGSVRGGVYNCDTDTWADGDMFSQRGRYLRRKTDYRAVFAEIGEKHFGNTTADRDFVIPSYVAASERNPADFAPLDFLTA